MNISIISVYKLMKHFISESENFSYERNWNAAPCACPVHR